MLSTVIDFFYDYGQFLFSTKLLSHAFIMFWVGPFWILRHLVKTKQAAFTDDHLPYEEPFLIRCADLRWVRDMPFLGGSAAFAFGIWGHLAALWLYSQGLTFLGDWFDTNAKMRAILGVFNLVVFTAGLIRYRGEIAKHAPGYMRLEGHWLKCGYVTARGPFFPIFWVEWFMKKIGAKAVVWVIGVFRDVETLISFIFSLISWPLLESISWITVRKHLVMWMIGKKQMKRGVAHS